MASARQYSFDILVVGGGPAGMAAASTAALSAGIGGRSVAIVDDNPKLGGQIWRGNESSSDKAGRANHNENYVAEKWYRRVRAAGVTYLPGLRVFDRIQAGILHAEAQDGGPCALRYRKLILATGARERFLPFPGWTLRNVFGAGGLQAMVKSGLPITGKRVVVAGSGPLLLAVAAYLKTKGAQVTAICEQASFSSLAAFTFELLGESQRLAQGLRYRLQLLGTPYHTGWWPIAALGVNRVEQVVVSDGRHTRKLLCDYLACGFHLVPNVELPLLLGCRVRNGYVDVDDLQQTSVPDVYCAGEPTAVGGLEQALIEGQIAGLATTGQIARAQSLRRKKQKTRQFAARLEKAFALRAELHSLPDSATIVCRCEDVTFARISDHASWRSAKLHTRCGMGPCQGRICGSAAEFLLGWKPDSVRPPIFPVRFGTIAAMPKTQEPISK